YLLKTYEQTDDPALARRLHNAKGRRVTMQLDKLTETSREALQAANTLAENWTNPEIEPEHLAVALLDQADGTAGPLLQAVGADPTRVKQDFSRELPRFPRVQ